SCQLQKFSPLGQLNSHLLVTVFKKQLVEPTRCSAFAVYVRNPIHILRYTPVREPRRNSLCNSFRESDVLVAFCSADDLSILVGGKNFSFGNVEGNDVVLVFFFIEFRPADVVRSSVVLKHVDWLCRFFGIDGVEILIVCRRYCHFAKYLLRECLRCQSKQKCSHKH